MARPEDAAAHAVDTVRKPRVHITYDVQVGNAIQLKELPFLVGVLGDFVGQPAEPLAPLKERKFIDISRDNFNEVLAGMKPRLLLSVKNTLSKEPDAPNLKTELTFKNLDDFSPVGVVRQVEPLNKLLQLRTKLTDIRGSLQGKEELEKVLMSTLGDAKKVDRLRAELGIVQGE
jgi:type VI secretion system protein ImpB